MYGEKSMIFTDRKKLTVIELYEKRDSLSFDELRTALSKRPSNMVYVEVKGILYGIISMGDVHRAERTGRDSVKINTCFTAVSSIEYMRVRQLFKEKAGINALPVVTADKKLLGDYSRWDDLLWIGKVGTISDTRILKGFWEKNSKVAIVKPALGYELKNKICLEWKQVLEGFGVSVEVIEPTQIMQYFPNVDKIVFADEDEICGTGYIYRRYNGKEFCWDKTLTISRFYDLMEKTTRTEIMDKLADAILENLSTQGVHVFSFGFDENESGDLERLNHLIEEKFVKVGIKKQNILMPFMREKFFEEIYSEEYQNVFMPHNFSISMQGGVPKVKDREEVLFHAKGGERLTTNQPENYTHSIYMYGPCEILGAHVEDKHTIASWLQAKLNEDGFEYRVINYGVAAVDSQSMLNKIAMTAFKQGDIVIWDRGNCRYEMVSDFNMVDILGKTDISPDWFIDDVRHCNYKVCKIYAEALYDKIFPILNCEERIGGLISKDDTFIERTYIDRYFSNNVPSEFSSVGAIVMNCNPFTYGHRYLIEEAKKRVECLIIFVVEEDRSLFSFKERLIMVRDGVADLSNVIVVPSGNFILSQTTFPEYFIKETDEDIIENIENDVTLFGEKIAPKLNITFRFVGEEKDDPVTNEYNKAMKRILPQYGIQVVEIPRKKQEESEDAISATTVRKCLEIGEIEKLSRLVPETTMRILFAKNE